VRLIELAAVSACKQADEREAIVMACRKLTAEIDELADQVLPPMSDEDKAVIATALNGRRS
jgi:hypothetical protein